MMKMKIENPTCLTPDSRFVKLWRVDCINEKGETHQWEFASRNNPPECVQKPSQANAVYVVPVHESGMLVVTKEYRPPINGFEYGFPAGLIDPGENVGQAAIRELFEETGLHLTEFIQISPPVYSSPGMTDESSYVAFVTCRGKPTNAHAEAQEQIEILMLDQTEIEQLAKGLQPFQNAQMNAVCWPIFNSIQLPKKPQPRKPLKAWTDYGT